MTRDAEPDALDPFRATAIKVVHIRRDRTLDPTIAQMQREIDALCLQVVRYEDTIAGLHRRNARQGATIRRLRLKGPRPHEWLLACLVCCLEAADRRMKAWGL